MMPGTDSDRVLLEHVRHCIERIRDCTGDGGRHSTIGTWCRMRSCAIREPSRSRRGG